jgi:hypothetical protein
LVASPGRFGRPVARRAAIGRRQKLRSDRSATHTCVVRFREDILGTIGQRVAALGLQACPVCDRQPLAVDRRPVILSVGGAAWAVEGSGADATTDVLYMLAVTCDLCGHAMLFNAEKFYGGDEPIFERD